MQGSYVTNNSYNNMKQYVVKSGDSLYMIAKAHNTTVEDLKSVNHLYSNTIYPNQILFIPKVKHCEMTNINKDQSTNELINKYSITLNEITNIPRQKEYYIVKESDTLESITQKYDISYKDLLILNYDKILIPGQKIIIEK